MGLLIALICIPYFLLLSFKVNSKPTIGIWLISIVVITNLIYMNIYGNYLLIINILGINLFLEDIVCMILILSIIIEGIKKKFRFKINIIGILYFYLIIFIIISFARGINSYSLGSSFNELRGSYFYVFIVASYVYLFGSKLSKKSVMKMINIITIIFILFFCINIISIKIFGFKIINTDQTLYTPYRFLNASQALLLSQFIIVFLNKALNEDGGIFSIWISLLVVLIVQHKTIWIIMVVSAMFLVILYRKRIPKLFKRIIIPIILLFLIIVPTLSITDNSLILDLKSSLNAFNNLEEGTFGDRVDGWNYLLSKYNYSNDIDYFIGKPFGSGYTRPSKNGIINYAPHNYYVQNIVRIGYLGAVSFILLYLIIFRRLIKYKIINNNLMAILLLTQMIYFITYSPSIEQGVILGYAMNICGKKKKEVSLC